MDDFFRVERGFEIADLVQILQGAGTPGTAGDTAAAPVGSTYQDNNDGSLWTKILAGVGTNKWQKLASENYVNNALGATVSWREPVVVRENVSLTLPIGTATSPIVVDGVSITDGQRVLFSAISGAAGPNVYVYNQSTGLFVEDINGETSGDAVYVQQGAGAGKTFVFNGTAWVQSGQASLDEEGYIRAYVGKPTPGAILPDYSSNNFISDTDDLTKAVGKLDGALGSNVSVGNYVAPANTVNANIQALDSEIGSNVTTGGFVSAANTVNANIQALDTQLGVALPVGNYITAGQTTNAAIVALDTEIGPNVTTGNFISGSAKVNGNIAALDTAIGAPVVAGTYVSPANSTNANIQALDTALAETTKATAVTNVTSITTVDSIPGAGSAKWLVRAANAADPTNVYATEVYAVSNGTAADYTKFATLRIGLAIAGLAVTVDCVAGELRLRVASTAAVNVTARRVGVVV
jgi:hypothetical protein